MSRGTTPPAIWPGTNQPSRLVTPLPTVITQKYFSQGTGDTWAAALSSNAQLAADTTNIYELRPGGVTDQALQVSSDGTNDPRISLTFSPAVDWSTAQLYLRFFLHDDGESEHLSAINCYVFSSGTDFIAYSLWRRENGNYPPKPGWAVGMVPGIGVSGNNRQVATGGTLDPSAVTSIRLDFAMDAAPDKDAAITLDTLIVTQQPDKAKLMVRLDDNGGDLDTILGLAAARDIRCVWACIANDANFNNANELTTAEFNAIKAMGNVDIVNHCHDIFGSADAAEGAVNGWVYADAIATGTRTSIATKRADINAAKAWMDAHGVSRWKDIVVIPGGPVADDDDELIADGTVRFLWGTSNGQVGGSHGSNTHDCWPIIMPHLRATWVTTSTVTTLLAQIDEAIDQKSFYCLQGHGALGGDELTDQEWTDLFDGIQTRVNAGTLEVVGMEAVLEAAAGGGARGRPHRTRNWR